MLYGCDCEMSSFMCMHNASLPMRNVSKSMRSLTCCIGELSAPVLIILRARGSCKKKTDRLDYAIWDHIIVMSKNKNIHFQIEEYFSRLGGKTIFPLLDLKDSFHQIKVKSRWSISRLPYPMASSNICIYHLDFANSLQNFKSDLYKY